MSEKIPFDAVLTVVEITDEKDGINQRTNKPWNLLKFKATDSDGGTAFYTTFKKSLFEFIKTTKEPFKAECEKEQKFRQSDGAPYWEFSVKQCFKPDGTPVAAKGTYGGGGGMSAEAAKELARGWERSTALRELGTMLREGFFKTIEDAEKASKAYLENLYSMLAKKQPQSKAKSPEQPQNPSKDPKKESGKQPAGNGVSRSTVINNVGEMMKYATKGLGLSIGDVRQLLQCEPQTLPVDKLQKAWEFLWDNASMTAVELDNKIGSGGEPQYPWSHLKNVTEMVNWAIGMDSELTKETVYDLLNITNARQVTDIPAAAAKLHSIITGEFPTEDDDEGDELPFP